MIAEKPNSSWVLREWQDVVFVIATFVVGDKVNVYFFSLTLKSYLFVFYGYGETTDKYSDCFRSVQCDNIDLLTSWLAISLVISVGRFCTVFILNVLPHKNKNIMITFGRSNVVCPTFDCPEKGTRLVPAAELHHWYRWNYQMLRMWQQCLRYDYL